MSLVDQLLASSVGVAVDDGGLITAASAAVQQQLELPSTPVGQRLDQLFEWIQGPCADGQVLVQRRGNAFHRCTLSPITLDGASVVFVHSLLAEARDRLERMTVPAIIAGVDGSLLDVNDAFAALLGYQRAQLRGSSWMALLHPDDLERCVKLISQNLREVTGFESRNRHSDGTYRWLEWHARFTPDDVLIECAALDITERQRTSEALARSDRMFRDAERIGHFGAWSLDVATQRLEWSDETYRIHEVPIGTPLQVDRAVEFYAPEARPLISEAVEQGMRDGTPWDMVLPLITAKGRRLTVHAQGRPEFRDGKLVRLGGIFHDVTEATERQVELAAAHSAAIDASNVKSRFLATMSHEMRTPLNGILGLTHLLADTPLAAEQRSLVEDTQACGEHLLNLVNDLLDIAKIEANKLELEVLPFSPHEVVREQLRPLQLSARPRGVTLEFESGPGVGELRLGDPVRFGQVVLNLVSNAVKFTLQGTVTVGLRSTERALELTVRDTGVGIAADRLKYIFDPFTQADASTTRRFGGTGLGLAICKQLVERMHGELAVESKVGEGSTFRITLPLPLATTLPRPTASLEVIPTQRSLRVLVAEDNAINARVATRFLERLGHRWVHVPDGASALATLATEAFDVVLMDVNMPVMDGLEATRRLRAAEEANRARRMPVIALTANAMRGDAELCARAGMDAHLTKPLREVELIDALTRVTHADEQTSRALH